MPSGQANLGEEPCAVTGLLSSQKLAIQGSWDLVNADAETNGMELFIRLFTVSPTTKQQFPKLRNVPLSEVRDSTFLIYHAQKAMAAVTYLVNCLDQPEQIVLTVQQLAKDHKGMGVTPADFKLVLTVLQSFMKDVLKYDNFTAQAWQTCCDVISSVAEAEMNKT